MEGATGELIRYRPTVPFKHYDKIARQIAWAYSNKFREDDYDLCNRNCEHLANMLVYGINYSEQIEDKKDIIRGVRWNMPPHAALIPINNDKGSTIKLVNEINETENKLNYTVSNH